MIVDKLRQLRPASGWKQILDVGCGDACFFRPASRIWGRGRGWNPPRIWSTLAIPIGTVSSSALLTRASVPTRQYSLILMLDVLEHLEDPVGALRHALDLLAPDRGGDHYSSGFHGALDQPRCPEPSYDPLYQGEFFATWPKGQVSRSSSPATSATGPSRRSWRHALRSRYFVQSLRLRRFRRTGQIRLYSGCRSSNKRP